MNKKVFLNLCLLLCLILPRSGNCSEKDKISSDDDQSKKKFGLFEDDEPLDVTLKFDLNSYFKIKPKEEYLKANITFRLGENDSVSDNIRLRTRGEFRNQNCYYAPIELNFKKADLGYKDLNKISKIKLVPECNTGSLFENYVMKEYLIYKLFNVLTDTSFRVRLLRLKMIDSEGKKKPVNQYGFFIEPVEMLAERTNSIVIKSKNLNQRNIYPKTIDRLALFNFMVGNFDWGVPGQHNVKIFKSMIYDTLMLATAIPYDFDWTGLVDAEYAIPAENIGTETIRDRIFVGICRSKEEYMKGLQVFIEKREEFYKVINDFPYINPRSKKEMIRYLESFYKMLEGKQPIFDVLLKSCKKL